VPLYPTEYVPQPGNATVGPKCLPACLSVYLSLCLGRDALWGNGAS